MNKTNISRSEEFQAILDKKPSWAIRWGILSFILFLLCFIFIMRSTNYTIKTRCRFTDTSHRNIVIAKLFLDKFSDNVITEIVLQSRNSNISDTLNLKIRNYKIIGDSAFLAVDIKNLSKKFIAKNDHTYLIQRSSLLFYMFH